MLQPRIAAPLRRALLQPTSICLRCQTQAIRIAPSTIRTISSTSKLRRPEPATKSKATETTPDPKDEETFVPKPLGRPIGFRDPPHAGENASNETAQKDYTGLSMRQKNIEKRKDLVEKWGTNYFRDFKNVRKYRSGKTFMANPRIFTSQAALYFPNFHGDTLEAKGADTTDILKGKISVVNIYGSHWGEVQAQTFTGKDENAWLHETLAKHPDKAQMVHINIEENSMKAMILSLFQFKLRASHPKEDWGKYFIVRQAVSGNVRENIGLLNGRVGYVYLIDQDCKIRWAGSGNAEGSEAQDLARGFAKLADAL